MNVALHCWAQRKGRPQETLAARGFLGRRGTENGPKLSNSSLRRQTYRMKGVHPRACGGEFKTLDGDSEATGPSPRVRGREIRPLGRMLPPGSIPARAGERAASKPSSGNTKVHPRACGGETPSVATRCGIGGPSPRVRGRAELGYGYAYRV